MNPSQFQYLSIQRAADFIGDPAGVNKLLGTLKATLDSDIPLMQQRLDASDTQGVNDLLHQFKGFAPVFCSDELVNLVIEVEALSKSAPAAALRQAMAPLIQQLLVLQTEVDAQIKA